MRNKKQDAWNAIALEMQLDRNEVEKKIRCLIGQYQRNCKESKKSGSGAGEGEPKWSFFLMFHFLNDTSAKKAGSLNRVSK